MSAGVYRIIVGDVFYIGSSANLRKGTLPNERLIKAFKKHGKASWVVTDYLRREEGETEESFHGRLRAQEQFRRDEVRNNPNFAGDTIPFQERMSRIMKERFRDKALREKLSAAKRGAGNPKSREVVVTKPDGTTEVFPCASAAARFFKVSQQTFDLWLRGVLPWPNKRSRMKNRWISDYRARYYAPEIEDYEV